MDNSSAESIPGVFQPPDKKVGESRNSEVWGYKDPDLVAKWKKQTYHEQVFPDSKAALDFLREDREAREKISRILQQLQAAQDTVPNVHPVVYRRGKCEVMTAEVQQWYKDGQTLRGLGRDVLKLSRSSLEELKKLFLLNLRLWTEEKVTMDMAGTASGEGINLRRVAKHLLPVFFSSNIVIDKNSRPHFIDVGLTDNKHETGLRGALRQRIQVAGTGLSLGIINLALLLKREKVGEKFPVEGPESGGSS